MAYLLAVVAVVAVYYVFRFKRQRDQYRAEVEWLRDVGRRRSDAAWEINPTHKIDVVL